MTSYRQITVSVETVKLLVDVAERMDGIDVTDDDVDYDVVVRRLIDDAPTPTSDAVEAEQSRLKEMLGTPDSSDGSATGEPQDAVEAEQERLKREMFDGP